MTLSFQGAHILAWSESDTVTPVSQALRKHNTDGK